MSENSIDASSAYTAPLKDVQYFVMWSIATIPCILSWFGSLSIIYIARRKFYGNIYHRLLFIISCIDFLATFWGYWNPFLMNDETGYKLSVGNQVTCTSVGFLIMFSLISKAFYSCYIALYFMLSVRYKWSDQRVMRYEPLAYLIAFCIPMSYGVVGFINQAFNPNEYRFCSIAKYPIGCEGDECVRGNLAPLISTLSTCTTLSISILAILCTMLLFCFVRHQTKQSARHDFAGTTGCIAISATNTETASGGGGSSSSLRSNRKQGDRSRLVRTQSILYVAANINNFIWLILFNRLVLNSLDAENIHGRDTIVFASGILCFLFMPMYGFFNFCIYCYPRFRRIRDHFPEKPFWRCLQVLYKKDQGESEITQQRLLKRHRQSRGNPLETSLGAISFSGTEEPPEQRQLQCMSKHNKEVPESGESRSFHLSGDTAIVLSFDDDGDLEEDIENDVANLVPNWTNDIEPVHNKHPQIDPFPTLHDEEMMMGATSTDNGVKMCVNEG